MGKESRYANPHRQQNNVSHLKHLKSCLICESNLTFLIYHLFSITRLVFIAINGPGTIDFSISSLLREVLSA